MRILAVRWHTYSYMCFCPGHFFILRRRSRRRSGGIIYICICNTTRRSASVRTHVFLRMCSFCVPSILFPGKPTPGAHICLYIYISTYLLIYLYICIFRRVFVCVCVCSCDFLGIPLSGDKYKSIQDARKQTSTYILMLVKGSHLIIQCGKNVPTIRIVER